ncbi:hypothetical protein A1OE_1215 [Candidatus Endolissoclinum faulkneri L2]|uniref:Uncharacterized protein n=1 Tax=Candidatus Endolissoclinum faulkneri L2 TaxID=1193729 RepID=K7ZDC0_9PROT|nr:hypothetical protein A1OE_1215 [Candidatus Endolissoclinum faulkneri L2]
MIHFKTIQKLFFANNLVQWIKYSTEIIIASKILSSISKLYSKLADWHHKRNNF